MFNIVCPVVEGHVLNKRLYVLSTFNGWLKCSPVPQNIMFCTCDLK